MTQQHPITPPLELVQQWGEQFEAGRSLYAMFEDIYRAGADRELEAIIELAGESALPEEDRYFDGMTVASLRAQRRPKPPSLKEQALFQLDTLNADLSMHGMGCDLSQIRRALESLPE